MARGGYTFEQMQQMDIVEILFLHHYQELNKNMYEEFITQALGVVWDKKDIIEKPNSQKDSKIDRDKLFIPLSVAINPEIMDFVKKQFNVQGKSKGPAYVGGGTYMPKPNEVISPMDDLSKEEFLKLLGRRH